MHCILALQLLLIVFFTPHIGQWSRANPNNCLHLGMQIFHRFSVRGRDLFLSNEIKASSGLNEQLEAQRNRVNSGLNEVEESQRIWIKSGLNEEEYSGGKDLYRFLHSQDRRRLVGNNKTSNNVLQFSSGNETMDYGDLFGWLHYTVIDVGTPNTSFLVALDTGSDQLWIPCQCKQCASTSNVSHLLNMPLQPYDPSTSNTSKQITCGSSLCYSLIPCANESDDCGYTTKYLSDNTSSSGVLFEDVIHLASATTGKHGGSIQFPFVFGCAQNQSGAFLNGGAPNGLLGLGFGEISLPSSLARSGLITNSFSMCFQDDGSGRIFFGDTGTPSQQTTPLLPLNTTHLPYVVGLDKIYVGNNIFSQSSVKIIVDTGTSFTYFPPKVYATLTAEFDGQVQLERAVFTDVPWEYCYKLSLNDDPVLPAISMVFQGGGNFSVVSPLVGIPNVNDSALDGFCLAIFESNIAILGQNFMVGYQLVFNREDMELGWSPSDCYKLEENEIFVPSPSPSVHQPVANAPSPFVPPGVHSIPPVVASSYIHSLSFYNIIFIFSLVLTNLMSYVQRET